MRKKSGLIILLQALTGCANIAGGNAQDTTTSITQSLPNSTEASESSIETSEGSTEAGENSAGKRMDIYEEDGLKLELVSELDGAGNILP